MNARTATSSLAALSQEMTAAVESFYAGNFTQALQLAEASLDAALCPEAFGLVAGVHDARGELRRAVAAYRRGLEQFPNNPGLAISFAQSLRRIPGRAPEAVKILMDIVRHVPDFAPARLSLIETLRTTTDHLDQAEAEAQVYVKLFPTDPNGHLACALAFLNRHRLRAAIAAADRSLALHGNALRAWEIKATAFIGLGSAPDAAACYRASLARHSDPDIHSRLLMAMQYCDTASETDIAVETENWVRLHTADIRPATTWPDLNFNPARPLTLGFMSRDFRQCSTLYLARPVLEHLPAAWTVTFYANVEHADPETDLFRSLCDRWVDIGNLDDNQAAARIAADGVDALIDLNGHILGGRPGVLARRPAPVQLTWLDYVGSTGLATIDAIIGDAGHLPLSDQRWYREPIRHVADNLYRYAPPLDAPDVAPLPALKNGFITFGCFNAAYKISAATLKLWGEILRALPTARLLLNAREYGYADTQRRLLDLCVAQGIDMARVAFRAGAPSPVGMLQSYADIDIALDPMPYSGGLTTLEALYMSVPVITMPGNRFGSRHSSVHLRCVGLTDWIADDASGYVALAVQKAADISALAALRHEVRKRLERSPLTDGLSLAFDIVALIRELWAKACAANA